MESVVARARRSAASACRRGFCRSRALFAWMRVDGREHLAATRGTGDLRGQSPEPHGHAGDHGRPASAAGDTASRRRWRRSSSRRTSSPPSTAGGAWFTNSLNYYLAALFFNAFPLPQREAGARQTLRYIGDVLEDGFSVLIFPEGERTDAGEIRRFRPGIGMIASRLDVPVVPVRLEGLDRVLHHTWQHGEAGPRAGRLRRAADAQRRRLRSAGAAGRGSRQEALDRANWSSGHLVIWSVGKSSRANCPIN